MGLSTSNTSETLPQWLGSSESHADRPETVEVVETHISWVFLTRLYAYKLKKPLKFDFLDFSTLDARHRACLEEVRLNRRLADDVYLGVVPVVRGGDGRFQLGGPGEAVDWLVKMRRLPDDRRLDLLLKEKRLSREQLEPVSGLLARFYRSQPPLAISAEQYRDLIEHHVRDNRAQLLRFSADVPQALVKRVHAAQLHMIGLSGLLAERAAAGRVIEGHGDLRPEHVYLVDPPVVIDCIEFNDQFRRIDVADELAFFAMECDLLQAEPAGQHVLQSCLEAVEDRPDERLLRFYKGYRACVRAKVAALRAEQVAGAERAADFEQARRYLHLADGYLKALCPPLLLVVRGLMGTGKTTLAAAVAEMLGAEHFQTDEIRRELLGPTDEQAPYAQGRYSPEQRERVYEEMLRRADLALRDGLPVVLDGAFLTRHLRGAASALGRSHSAVVQVVRCHCPPEVAQQRMAKRLQQGRSASEARPELLRRQQRDEEPEDADQSLEVDTTLSRTAQTDAVLAKLAQQIHLATKITNGPFQPAS